jgi:very-short-patch-repair endonuclease
VSLRLNGSRRRGVQQLLGASAGELALETRLAQLGRDLPPYTREYQFSKRKWRFDFAWPAHSLACEVDGGQHAPRGGRHAGDADRHKLNAAAERGWRVMHFSPAMLERDPEGVIQTIRSALAHPCYDYGQPTIISMEVVAMPHGPGRAPTPAAELEQIDERALDVCRLAKIWRELPERDRFRFLLSLREDLAEQLIAVTSRKE